MRKAISTSQPEVWNDLPKFGYVYLIKNQAPHSHVKIGTTSTLPKRIRDLRYGVDLSKSVMYRFPTDDEARRAEGFLHSRLHRLNDLRYGELSGNEQVYARENHPGYTEWFKIDADEKARTLFTQLKKVLNWWSEIPAQLITYNQQNMLHAGDTPSALASEQSSGRDVLEISEDLRALGAQRLILSEPGSPPDQYRSFVALPNSLVGERILQRATRLHSPFKNKPNMSPYHPPVIVLDRHLIVETSLAQPNVMELCRETAFLGQACLGTLNLSTLSLKGSSLKILFDHLGSPRVQKRSLNWPRRSSTAHTQPDLPGLDL